MTVTLQYFDGCPSWKQADALLAELRAEGAEFEVSYELIETQEAAEEAGFRGSPTILVDGVDPFADPEAPVGLSCRVYETASGYAGVPTKEELRAALTASG